MDICNIEQAQNLFAFYYVCFSSQFPELHFSCNEVGFLVNGVARRYRDITRVSYSNTHFLVEMKGEYILGLPIAFGQEVCIMKKRPLPGS